MVILLYLYEIIQNKNNKEITKEVVVYIWYFQDIMRWKTLRYNSDI